MEKEDIIKDIESLLGKDGFKIMDYGAIKINSSKELTGEDLSSLSDLVYELEML